MMEGRIPALAVWAALLVVSVLADVVATAYLKVAGDRLGNAGFVWAAAAGVLVFAPSIVAFGYALRAGPSYAATVGTWAVGVYAGNAVAGVMLFGDSASWRLAAGLAAAAVAVGLLKPAG
jgi:multidrug transporter EmrE-like cation transporter